MADKFRVGQKVRIVNCATNPQENGRICVVMASIPKNGLCGIKIYQLADGSDSSEECLEPVYDGDEKSSWSECLWKPRPIVHSIEDEITTDTGGE